MEDERQVAVLEVQAEPGPVVLDARVDVARQPDLDLGAARDLRILQGLAQRRGLGRDQPRQAARVLLGREDVIRALRVVAVELVVHRRGHRLVLVHGDLHRAAVEPHLLGDDVLQLVAAAVEVAAVGLDAEHLGDVPAAAAQDRDHRLLLGRRAVEHDRRLGPDEGVDVLVLPLQLHARHRGAAALVLGRAAPGQAPAVAQAEPVARGRERGQRDQLLLLAGRIGPARHADVGAGVGQIDRALGQVVDAQDQRALDLPLGPVEVLVEDAVRERLVAGEPGVVVVEEQGAERVGSPEPPARHARDRLARLGEHVLVGEGQVEADVDEAGLAARAAVDHGRRGRLGRRRARRRRLGGRIRGDLLAGRRLLRRGRLRGGRRLLLRGDRRGRGGRGLRAGRWLLCARVGGRREEEEQRGRDGEPAHHRRSIQGRGGRDAREVRLAQGVRAASGPLPFADR